MSSVENITTEVIDTHFDERANRLTCATKHGAAEVANPYACSTLKFTHTVINCCAFDFQVES